MSSHILDVNTSSKLPLTFLELAYTAYTVLTDNKTYRLQIDENSDGTRDFRLATVSDTYPEEEDEKISAILEKYGFLNDDIFNLKSLCSSDPYIKKIREGKSKSFS